jgi:hypothetical protein
MPVSRTGWPPLSCTTTSASAAWATPPADRPAESPPSRPSRAPGLGGASGCRHCLVAAADEEDEQDPGEGRRPASEARFACRGVLLVPIPRRSHRRHRLSATWGCPCRILRDSSNAPRARIRHAGHRSPPGLPWGRSRLPPPSVSAALAPRRKPTQAMSKTSCRARVADTFVSDTSLTTARSAKVGPARRLRPSIG